MVKQENKENERQTSLTKNLFKVDSLTKLFIFVKMAGTLRFAIHWLKCDIYVFAKFIAKLMTFKFFMISKNIANMYSGCYASPGLQTLIKIEDLKI